MPRERQARVRFESRVRREAVVGKPSNARLNFPVGKEERQERNRAKADDNGQEGPLHDPRSLISPREPMRMRAKGSSASRRLGPKVQPASGSHAARRAIIHFLQRSPLLAPIGPSLAG
jgi:hypothetical protein